MAPRKSAGFAETPLSPAPLMASSGFTKEEIEKLDDEFCKFLGLTDRRDVELTLEDTCDEEEDTDDEEAPQCVYQARGVAPQTSFHPRG